MTENEALNWKTRAIAYEDAFMRLFNDFTYVENGIYLQLVEDRLKEAAEYIRIWRRDENNGS